MAQMLNFEGIFTAVASLLVIGIFHPLVIKCEYRFSEKIWPLFLVAGIAFCSASVFTKGIVSLVLALLGSACIWSIRELKEQTKRVERGWFPKNKKRLERKDTQTEKTPDEIDLKDLKKETCAETKKHTESRKTFPENNLKNNENGGKRTRAKTARNQAE